LKIFFNFCKKIYILIKINKTNHQEQTKTRKQKDLGTVAFLISLQLRKTQIRKKKSEQESFPKLATPITEILHGPIKQKAQARDIVPVELFQFLTDFVRRKDQY
jgi:hypothetical protein